MSRHGYSEECDGWDLIRWRGAVTSAIRGKRGQSMLRELAAALDALPEKRLAAESLVNADGEYCALGALGRARGMDMATIEADDRQAVAEAFGIAEALAAEIMYLNDEYFDEPYQWISVDICGPVRPGPPDFGSHRRSVRVPIENAGERRWRAMRKWVDEQLKAGA